MTHNPKFKTALFATILLGATALSTAAIQAAPPSHAATKVEVKHTTKLAANEAKEVEGTKADVKEDKAEAHKKADAIEDKTEAKMKHAHTHKMTKEKL